MTTQQAEPLNDGNYLDGVVRPCGDRLRSRVPQPPPSGPTIGVTISGGGFRATLAGLGVVRYLADARLLQNVRYVSSVSGGSITNAGLAKNWSELRSEQFDPAAVDAILIDPIVDKITGSSLKSFLLRNSWRAVGSKNRTDVLAYAFDKWFVGDTTMDTLDPEVRWIINAANLATGTRFTFEQDVVGDYVNGYAEMAEAKIPLALATATSAAVPGAFAPITLPELELPCRGADTVSLLDGGAYDNTGLEAIDSYDHLFTIALTAGGIFRVGGYGKLPIIKDLTQANSVLYRQSRGLRTSDLVDKFKRKRRKGLLFNLGTDIATRDRTAATEAFEAAFPPRVSYGNEPLGFVETSFNRFDAGLARHLIHRGWWLTGATLATYHPDLSPSPQDLNPPRV